MEHKHTFVNDWFKWVRFTHSRHRTIVSALFIAGDSVNWTVRVIRKTRTYPWQADHLPDVLLAEPRRAATLHLELLHTLM